MKTIVRLNTDYKIGSIEYKKGMFALVEKYFIEDSEIWALLIMQDRRFVAVKTQFLEFRDYDDSIIPYIFTGYEKEIKIVR